MSPTSYQTAPPRVTCRSSGVYYHSIGPSLCQSFFAKDTQFFCSGRQAARSLISPLQTPAVCGKIPPFPAPRRKRARTARPPVPCQESRLPGCEGGHGPRRAPVSALPRPIPDGPPPISGANKGENAFRPLRPHREVWRAAALRAEFVSPGCAGRAGSLRPGANIS